MLVAVTVADVTVSGSFSTSLSFASTTIVTDASSDVEAESSRPNIPTPF